MTYRFTGFLTSDKEFESNSNHEKGYAIRKIDEPFTGGGICLSTSDDIEPLVSEIIALSNKVGLTGTDNWIFLNYVCWGGSIDSVFGYVNFDGGLTGPIEESNLEKVTESYVELMSLFGVAKEHALDFKPFYRGFWGEQ